MADAQTPTTKYNLNPGELAEVISVYGKGYISDLAQVGLDTPDDLSESDWRELEMFREGLLVGRSGK